MNKPKQAVILCGGLGTRLKPLTLETPKPMVLLNNKPFLLYLLEQLSEQGVKKFLLLTGYLGEQVSDYFGNGEDWGWEIEYSHGPVDWDTGKRLWEARSNLQGSFLLLYSDNFVSFKFKKLWDFHQKENKPLTIMLSAKSPGNIRVNNNGGIEAYDPLRQEKNLNYVEIGYMIIHRDVMLSFFNNPEVSFTEILSRMAKENQLAGYVMGDSYHSISDPIRLKKMQSYLDNNRILILDRDGVINQGVPKGEYVSNWSQFKLIGQNIKALKILSRRGFRFIIISNQAGVSRGMISEEDLDVITEHMMNTLKEDEIEILATYICKHHWDDECSCRKPKPGHFYQASRDWLFRLDKSLFIGDDSRDCQAAYNSGCGSIFIGDQLELGDLESYEMPISSHKNLFEALPDIYNFYGMREI